VPVEISVNRLSVDDTELACAIVKDISARKRAEDSTNRLEQILNSTSAVIYEKDSQGRYEFVNNCWAHLFDIDPNLQHVFEELRSYASPLHLERTRCNLSALVHEAWEEVASVSTAPDVRLQVIESELDLTCDVDAFRIRQIFRNILENAIGASSAPSSITVEWCHANLATGPAQPSAMRVRGSQPSNGRKLSNHFTLPKSPGRASG
jgi:signal transduction histidine kinase